MENPFKDETLLARWLAGELTPDELETLRQREDFADFVEIIEGLKGLEAPRFSEELLWQKLQEKLSLGKTPKPETRDQNAVRRHLTPWKYVAGIAAAVALVLAALWWLQGDGYPVEETIATQAGEQKKVDLPDGSTVTLNALSTLGYAAKKWPSKRYVVLDGEGYFQAKKGRRFTVHTRQGEVRVVGTAFNVYARGVELEVKCTRGKVQVINPEGTERVLLKRGEQVSVVNGRMQKRKGVNFYPAWYKGESTFRETPLQKVLDEMGRQYGLIVLADSIGTRSFSGKFVHKDLNKALKMVCGPMRLKYSLTGDTLRIAPK
ncbi:MAG: FecR family protein [Saprospiraceae bacterium]